MALRWQYWQKSSLTKKNELGDLKGRECGEEWKKSLKSFSAQAAADMWGRAAQSKRGLYVARGALDSEGGLVLLLGICIGASSVRSPLLQRTRSGAGAPPCPLTHAHTTSPSAAAPDLVGEPLTPTRPATQTCLCGVGVPECVCEHHVWGILFRLYRHSERKSICRNSLGI